MKIVHTLMQTSHLRLAHFGRALFIVMAMLYASMAYALPFEPTTDPSLSTTCWYNIQTEGYFLSVAADERRATVSTSSEMTDADLWCFVGDNDSGYKIYNKHTKTYLGDQGVLFGADSPYLVFYKYRTDNTFYLFHIDEDGMKVYLYYDTEFNVLSSYATSGNDTDGCFEAIFVKRESGGTTSSPTRYDIYGVGYSFIEGGTSYNSNETAKNLIDNNAETKFFGNASELWIVMEATSKTFVTQYSLVTANDSHDQSGRTPRSWKLQGSNDRNTWTDIDVRTDCPLVPLTNQQEVTFTINDYRFFRYFKFICTAGASSSVQLSEIWINPQQHSWQYEGITSPTCAVQGEWRYVCSDCKAIRTEAFGPTGYHNYVDGICSVCGKNENETVLLDHGQLNPYTIKALHNYRNGSVWPNPPTGWTSVDFDDSLWEEIPMPTASPNHSDGPYNGLKYNSHWYGEYNCYWFRRSFELPSVNPNATYIFRCVHDDNMVVYVNDVEVINALGWTDTPNNCNWDNSYQSYDIPASAFCEGTNEVAVYMEQNFGGAYFDYQLVAINGQIAGDVNGDGVVSGADVTALYNVLLDNATVAGDADVNGDGVVSGADVTALYNLLLQ